MGNNHAFDKGLICAQGSCARNEGGSLRLLNPQDVVIGEFRPVEGESPHITLKSAVYGREETRVRITACDPARMDIFGRSDLNRLAVHPRAG